MRDRQVVAYERQGVLPQRDRYPQLICRIRLGHADAGQYVEADQAQFDHARLDRGDVHGVNAPSVAQSFGGRGEVGRFLAGCEP